MLVLTQIALRRGFDLEVNMLGRWAVWPVMCALALALVIETLGAERRAVRRTGDDPCGHGSATCRMGCGQCAKPQAQT